MVKNLLIFLIFFLFPVLILAHVCDDVLRDDPIVVWPEKEIIEITKTGYFKIFLRNDYGSNIHEVRLIVPESLFEISVYPSLIEKVAPKEKVFFEVFLTIPEEIKPDNYPFLIKIDAREFEITRDINLIIKVKQPPVLPEPQPTPKLQPEPIVPEQQPKTELQIEPKAEVEIVPEKILVATSIFPEEIDIRPGQTKEFKAFLRSGYDKSLHNITLSIEPMAEFKITTTPEVIQELKPNEKKFFTLLLYVPPETKFGQYQMRIDFKANEFPVKRHLGDVLIRVSEGHDWKTVFYFLAIILIIFILIWRYKKLTQKQPTLRLKQ